MNLDKSEMLYKLFVVQWKLSRGGPRGDWSEMVKEDLDDLKINKDLEVIKSKSKLSFKKLLKNYKVGADYIVQIGLRPSLNVAQWTV